MANLHTSFGRDGNGSCVTKFNTATFSGEFLLLLRSTLSYEPKILGSAKVKCLNWPKPRRHNCIYHNDHKTNCSKV